MKQKDLIEELGFARELMGGIRKRHLASQDWFHWGKGNAVWITYEGQRKLRLLKETEDVPNLAHNFEEVEVLGPAPNSAMVYIKVFDGDGEAVKAPCVVPRNLRSRLTRGKRIRVEVVSDREGTSYRHERLCDYPAPS